MSAPEDSTTRWEQARDEGTRLLEQHDLAAAAHQLRVAADGDPGGESHALLGLALFRAERYEEAASSYSAALQADPTRDDWAHMHRLAAANAEAEVHVAVPEVSEFEAEALLAPPAPGDLPDPPVPGPDPSPVERARYIVGHGLGAVGGKLFDVLTERLGRQYSDAVWTNWYRKKLYSGILTLAYMRDKLNLDNLRSAYPAGAKVGFAPEGLVPPPGVTHFRTADGSWNNLEDPKEGAAGTRFARNVDPGAARPPSDDELLDPDPRLISRRLLTRREDMPEVPFLNMLAAAWIQFMNDDWITHGETTRREMIEIPLAQDDPARQRYRQQHMFVGRTQPDPTRRESGEAYDATFINEVTHWWDGSQIYGSDQATQDRLRSHTDGKLRIEPDGRLPLGQGRVEDTGMVRNWWVGLSLLHTLFVREHNAICDHLKARHPDWDDHRLFNVARLINAAVMAKIHTIEWTPAILPEERLTMGLNANWFGMLTYRLRKPDKRKTVATFNVPNAELGGLVGNALEKHGSPYALSQEFVEVYRLHSLLPETLRLRSHGDDGELESVPFAASRQAGAPKLTSRVPMADLFYSFGTQHPGALVLNNYPRFMQELSIPGNPLFDMGAIDILRARERGVPRYNEFRRQLGLNPIRTFEDLTADADHVATLKEVYGDDVEKLDLMVGTLAEGHRPTGFGFGETMFQIFILNASRRLQADRFFTTDYREEVYTAEGMAWVDRASLKEVLLRHYPELAGTGLANIKNAFEPWDTGTLDPARHPLRAFEPELRKDPWKGDAARR